MRRIYAREEVCMACRLCEVHCAVQHSQTRHLIKAFKTEEKRPLPRLTVEVQGALSFSFQCRHCDEPVCLHACISGAMHRDPDGAVRVDEARCIGCWTCILACPYGAIRREETEQASPFALKCDLCPDLAVPACVSACPNDALLLVDEPDPALPMEVEVATA